MCFSKCIIMVRMTFKYISHVGCSTSAPPLSISATKRPAATMVTAGYKGAARDVDTPTPEEVARSDETCRMSGLCRHSTTCAPYSTIY
ncbi:hypothetical protein FKM82_018416 [Ascaphus truei]